MGSEKAPPTRGTLSRIRDGEIDAYLEFQYNPTKVRRTRGVRWTYSMPPGGVLPIPMHGSADPHKLTVELFLDAREHANRLVVKQQLAFLEGLTLPVLDNASDIGRFKAPPLVLLTLGSRSWYVTIDRVDTNEEMFDQALEVIRARATLSMTGVFISEAIEQQMLNDFADESLLPENVWIQT